MIQRIQNDVEGFAVVSRAESRNIFSKEKERGGALNILVKASETFHQTLGLTDERKNVAWETIEKSIGFGE